MGVQASKGTNPHSIKWHRTPLSSADSKAVHKVTDLQGFKQAGGYLAMLFLWFGLALHFQATGQCWLSLFFTLTYGCQANFLINGMHELGHGFVFKTKWVNSLFLRVVSFLGWLHPDMFFSSHFRHHRYTQNFPHDQENPQPVIPTAKELLKFAFINLVGGYEVVQQTCKVALGVYPTKHLWWTPMWEEVCYKPDDPSLRRPPMMWAQFMLLGHAAIASVSVLQGLWLIPVMISLGPFYMGGLFYLCNSVQHIGLHHGDEKDGAEVPDFRLSTRTFYINDPDRSSLNPIGWPFLLVRFWYFHMNYHIEHHMYAAVPCYNLEKLHNAIKHDLPPIPNGFVSVWSDIITTLKKQKKDAKHCMQVELPLGISSSHSANLSPELWAHSKKREEHEHEQQATKALSAEPTHEKKTM